MADTNSSETCNSCLFFIVSDRGMGLCKRYPDVINKHNTDWCGEFSPDKSAVTIKNIVVSLAKEPESIETPVKKPGRPKKEKK